MKNFIMMVRRIVREGFVLWLVAFCSFSCIDMPNAPVAPMSDIQLTGISLIDVTKTFADFLARDSTLKRNSDGTSSYIKYQTLASQGFPAIILQPQSSTEQVRVGKFTVIPFSLSSNDKASDLGFPRSGPSQVPPGSINLPPVSVDQTSNFDYIQVDTGSFSLTITNNLPVPIDFPGAIVLRNNFFNPRDTSTIAVFPIPATPLPANGGSVTIARVRVDGKLIRGSLTTDSIQCHTTGSFPAPVNFIPASGISVSLQSSELLADSASAVVPAQTMTSSVDSVIFIDRLTVVKSAEFTKGLILFRLVNTLGVDVGVSLTVKEMIQNGQSFSINQTLAAKQTRDIPLDFSTIRFQSDSLRGKGTTARISVQMTTIDSHGAKTVVSENDYVQALFIPQDPLAVKSVDGKIQPTIVPINSAVSSGINGADLGNLTAQVALKGMQLTLNLLITGGFPTDYHLAFIAKNSMKNKVDSIRLISGLSTDFPRIFPNGIDTAKIRLSNQAFSDLLGKFIPDVPDSFIVRGYLTMDPQDIFDQSDSTYEIKNTDRVYPSYLMNFPLALGIKNGVLTEVVPFSKDQIPKDFTKSISEGTLTFYFYNKFPFAMLFHANFLGNYNLQTHRGDTLLSLASGDTIQPASVDVNGLTTAPTFSKMSLSLNHAQMIQFNKADSLSLRLELSTNNNGQIVKVRDTDYIRVYAKGDITYTQGKQ